MRENAGRILFFLLIVAQGCSSLDIGQPIALVPTDELDEIQVVLLERAAGCWNARFGTQLVVSDSGTTSQEVSVGFNEAICLYAAGRTETTIPVEVNVCDAEAFRVSLEFQWIVLHELGHVLNIRSHTDDPDAIMARSSYPQYRPTFQPDDEELLREANPDFEIARCPGYSVVHSPSYGGHFHCECSE